MYEIMPEIKQKDQLYLVDARELHTFLKVGKDFSTWIKDRIRKYELIENQDYFSLTKIGEREIGATRRIDYELTLDTAKQLCMVENNEMGRKARQYFIDIEKRFKQSASMQIGNESFIAVIQANTQLMQQMQETLKSLTTAAVPHRNLTYHSINDLEQKEINFDELNLEVTEMPLRMRIRFRVNYLAKNANFRIANIYAKIYDELMLQYGIMRPKVQGKKSILEILEERNHLPKVDAILQRMINKYLPGGMA